MDGQVKEYMKGASTYDSVCLFKHAWRLWEFALRFELDLGLSCFVYYGLVMRLGHSDGS